VWGASGFATRGSSPRGHASSWPCSLRPSPQPSPAREVLVVVSCLRAACVMAPAAEGSKSIAPQRHSAAVGHNQNGVPVPYTRSAKVCVRSVCGDAGLAMGAPASARGTAKQKFQRRCSKAMHAEHADGNRAAAPPVTRCRQRVTVDIECVIDGLGAARKHQRVLRASPHYICAGFFSVLRRHSHATHPSRQVAGNSSHAAVISKVNSTEGTE
jgi:hypothetical protein